MSEQELMWLGENCIGIGVEIGTHCGRSASIMVNADHLTCVDSWFDLNINNMQVNGGGEACFWKFLKARDEFPFQCDALKMTSAEAASRFEDQSLDFVFIDGSHDYDSVSTDIQTWIKKVKSNGLICGHDFDYAPVKNAVYENVKTNIKVFASIWYARV